MDKRQYDSFDAGYYLDSNLTLKKDAPGQMGIWSLPSVTTPSKLLKTIDKGNYVGTIDSWVMDGNNDLWWKLVGGGYVKHRTGYFDINIANSTSSGKAIDDKKAAEKASDLSEQISDAASGIVSGASNLVQGVGNFASDLGGNLKLYLLLIVGILILIKFAK